ncbi:hypothetical protein HK097_001886 [Rhizophlyctis rosea]|uniref:RNA-dependent RNA polymerase n=1 Tax=Rhizophlyctis rosea TaxID=64517 RepID=A0AAD5X3D8_9FUNG|nr:hypothetical protein HK097_001886 [Rhizophlyctis rosea]
MFSGSVEGVEVWEGVETVQDLVAEEEEDDLDIWKDSFWDDKKNMTNRKVTTEGTVMTDGNGLISAEVLEKLREKCGWEVVPCAIQARYGSCKGTWMLFAPTSFPNRRSKRNLLIRKSQEKYEIPFIRILAQNGVGKEVFERLVQEGVRRIGTKIEACGSGVSSVRELGKMLEEMKAWRKEGDPRGAKALWEGERAVGVEEDDEWCVEVALKMLDAGIKPTESHHLSTLLTHCLRLLLHPWFTHLKITVPKARRLLILPDPTGTLPAGTAYLHIPHTCAIYRHYIGTIAQSVVVGRNPAFLKSDMRKVACVVDSSGVLEKYRDVFVVSTKGKRPLADWLGGGDYDGDEVWVCWDEDVVGSFTQQDEDDPVDVGKMFQMDDRKVATVTIGGGSDMQLAERFSDALWEGFLTMPRDPLGLFVRAFDRLADQVGIDHPDCKALAAICVELLDAAKAGKRLGRGEADVLRGKGESAESPLWLKAHCGDEVPSPFVDPAKHGPPVPYSRGSFRQEETSILTWLYELTWKVCRETYLERVEAQQDSGRLPDGDMAAPWLRVLNRGMDNQQVALAAHHLHVEMTAIRDDFLAELWRIWDPNYATTIIGLGDIDRDDDVATIKQKNGAKRKRQEAAVLRKTAAKILNFDLTLLSLPEIHSSTPDSFHNASIHIRCSLAYFASFPHIQPVSSNSLDLTSPLSSSFQKMTIASPSPSSSLVTRLRKWSFPFRIPEVLDVLIKVKRREEDMRLGREYTGTRVVERGIRDALRYK